VLDDSGAGTLSDALQGIQWVIYHAREYNIKVLNISLAASSPETWLTDPLCVAVRSATAAGNHRRGRRGELRQEMRSARRPTARSAHPGSTRRSSPSAP
jgi:hypothetical protein